MALSLSLHKSKGLTARIVIIIGCIEGAIPHVDFDQPQAQQQRSLEEQRRLFCVAITRTTETLILSSVTHVRLHDAWQMRIEVVRLLRRSHLTATLTA